MDYLVDQETRLPSQPPGHRRSARKWLAIGSVALLALIGGAALAVSPDGSGHDEAAPGLEPDSAVTAASPTPTTSAPQTSAAPAPAQAAQSGTALAALETLPIKGRAPKTGYDRDTWHVWSDFDGNGCDQRQDTLARDLTEVQRVGCDVVGGTLVDPYTGRTITIPTADPQIDIDHVVALSDAWQKGAAGWTDQQRKEFASDPLNLLAVSSSANRSKSDGDAATWLPPNKAYRCDLVARQIAVKQEYGLWITQAEHDAMAGVLSTCPSQSLPQRGADPAPVHAVAGGATTSSGIEVDPALDPQIPSCKALLAAGYAGDYVRGSDPEYDWYRDGDGDGVVCE